MYFLTQDRQLLAPDPDYRVPVRVYIGVGSNIDPCLEIALGLEQLASVFGRLEISQAYRSAAVGFEGPPFINLVVGFTTEFLMQIHSVRVAPSRNHPPKSEQLAWRLAETATDESGLIETTVANAVIDRLIDSTAVALSALNHPAAANARSQAVAHASALHPRSHGARIFGLPGNRRYSVEWAAYANAIAIGALEGNDAFAGAETVHPSSTIAPILAVAQQCGRNGVDLLRGLVAGYELHIALAKAIGTREYGIDASLHLGPAAAGGIGACLGLDTETVYQALQQTLHTSAITQLAHSGDYCSWTFCAAGHAGKLAIEATDRCLRNETAAAPIYEGEDGVLARLVGGDRALYHVELPDRGQSKRAILSSSARQHKADYRAQPFIDLAIDLHSRLGPDIGTIEEIVIYTSRDTDRAIGTGSDDPRKFDPQAERDVLARSLMYIFAVALQDGRWDAVTAYASERAHRADTAMLWRRIRTVAEARTYNASALERYQGGRAEIRLQDGRVVTGEIAVAHAHPLGAKPFGRQDYIQKFHRLADGVVSACEQRRFLQTVQRLPQLAAGELGELNVVADLAPLTYSDPDGRGIF